MPPILKRKSYYGFDDLDDQPPKKLQKFHYTAEKIQAMDVEERLPTYEEALAMIKNER